MMTKQREIVLLGAVRTAIGKFGGELKDVTAAELGAVVIKEALNRACLLPGQVSEVLMGCVLQAAQGQNVARQSALLAGLPHHVPAQTLNMVCGSGLSAVNLAAAMIASNQADIVVAGGTENMSAAPYTLDKARFGYRMNHGVLTDIMINDALWCASGDYHMGITAENLAEKYDISREEQDEFAANSQQKTLRALVENRFADEIVPVTIKNRKETIIFDKDEYPRAGVTIESLAKLPPAFKHDGTVTAANASGINDGAAAVVVMSAEKAKELKVTPMAKWISGASEGVEPEIMGIGPVFSSRKALKRAGMTIEDIDLIESNEAFAVQSLAVTKELKWDLDKVNVNGGAISLGHPVGASGTRILVTLLHEMQKRGSTHGLATLCVGGGMGVSTIVQRV